MMPLETLIQAVGREYKREQRPIYIWIHFDNQRISWALSTDRKAHIAPPDFIYNGPDWLRQVNS